MAGTPGKRERARASYSRLGLFCRYCRCFALCLAARDTRRFNRFAGTSLLEAFAYRHTLMQQFPPGEETEGQGRTPPGRSGEIVNGFPIERMRGRGRAKPERIMPLRRAASIKWRLHYWRLGAPAPKRRSGIIGAPPTSGSRQWVERSNHDLRAHSTATR